MIFAQWRRIPRGPRRIATLGVAFAALLLATAGCHTAGYYAQAIRGHLQIVCNQKPIPELLARTNTPPQLKAALERVLRLRAFAETNLHLPANGHYLRYVDIGRPYVVWNVYAAPEFDVEAHTWWYPFVGRLEYQGYFSEAGAKRYAARLARNGFDVYVGGSQAYSTLGWFRDPVLNTFIGENETGLADLLFHELAHQKLFLSGDTDFNEAFATAVAEEGVRRWLIAQQKPEAFAVFQREREREAEFVALVLKARDELATLYATRRGTDTPDVLRQRKAAVIEKLRCDYETLKTHWGGYAGYDGWMTRPLNNAQLNSLDTYYHLVPQFRRLLQKHGDDLPAFFDEVRALKPLKKFERIRRMHAISSDHP